jgi:senataxin
LVCAPSNAAIDELAQRIRDGHVGSENKSNTVNIVRIGPEQTLSPSVRDISLDYLVDQKLDSTPKPLNDISNEIKSIREEIEMVKNDWKAKREEMDTCASNSARFMTLENEVKTLNARKQTLINKLDSKKDQQKSDSRTLDTLRRNTRNQILFQADIICSTLAGAGHESLESLEFDMIIIDEAAQAIELSSLIPLKYGCSHCIMVGDPQQLPPTVISPEVSKSFHG